MGSITTVQVLLAVLLVILVALLVIPFVPVVETIVPVVETIVPVVEAIAEATEATAALAVLAVAVLVVLFGSIVLVRSPTTPVVSDMSGLLDTAVPHVFGFRGANGLVGEADPPVTPPVGMRAPMH